MDIVKELCKELGLMPTHIKTVISLIDEGNTIPFIARYRKEMTGSMDDQVLRQLFDRLNYLRNLDKRREEIISSITSQDKMTYELLAQINDATILAALEDLYRPYKQKRRTRGTVAREKGLEPLAKTIFEHQVTEKTLEDLALKYIDIDKGVETAEDALNGASDIIAEDVSDNPNIRKNLKKVLTDKGILLSKSTSDEDSVYRLYYDYKEPINKMPSHRVLAINRGEKEGTLKISISLDENIALDIIFKEIIQAESISTAFIKTAAEDAYSRLIFPSIEREIRNTLTETADEQAIKMFALNLEPLIMQPPVKNKVTMGFDPAYRTGCKIAVVDATGRALDTTVVYPTPPNNKKEEAEKTLVSLIKKHGVEIIAIGNGTASKESEIFVSDMIKSLSGLSYMVVNEAGASVYSASKLGAEEFPEFDVSLRSAVSIARRLQDPLAELVKIDPKSIGVGQYQHDMPQGRLSETLTGVVENCVGRVGVDLNTASMSLLNRVSGLNATIAKNIVDYRNENGIFTDRKILKKVPKLGPKSFIQCAGFLRISESNNIFDNTSVHPESYKAAEKLLHICGYKTEDVKTSDIKDLREKVKELGKEKVAENCGIGALTVDDIINELLKPGRDPRDELPPPMLRTDVLDMKDLKQGMILKGTVRNVVDFGVFVDIGVHQDGLVHISHCSDKYIKHPNQIFSVGDIVNVMVLDCDPDKHRIALSIKQAKINNS